jgi:hypothetical protein
MRAALRAAFVLLASASDRQNPSICISEITRGGYREPVQELLFIAARPGSQCRSSFHRFRELRRHTVAARRLWSKYHPVRVLPNRRWTAPAVRQHPQPLSGRWRYPAAIDRQQVATFLPHRVRPAARPCRRRSHRRTSARFLTPMRGHQSHLSNRCLPEWETLVLRRRPGPQVRRPQPCRREHHLRQPRQYLMFPSYRLLRRRLPRRREPHRLQRLKQILRAVPLTAAQKRYLSFHGGP